VLGMAPGHRRRVCGDTGAIAMGSIGTTYMGALFVTVATLCAIRWMALPSGGTVASVAYLSQSERWQLWKTDREIPQRCAHC
jgi:hypothetical protein